MLVATSDSKPQSEAWYLDTGCSNQMTGHKEWLGDFDENRRSNIRLADNRTLSAKGMRNILIQRKDGKTALIENVLYVPGMRCNLMSVSQLVEKGFSVSMKDGMLELLDPNLKLVLRSSFSRNRTFQANIKAAEVQCLMVTKINQLSWLWHLRFGHLNFKSLNMLVTNNMVIGLPKLNVPKKGCDVCLIGKQPRNSFNSHLPIRAYSVLGVVHSDVCGAFEVPSLGGNKYFTSF